MGTTWDIFRAALYVLVIALFTNGIVIGAVKFGESQGWYTLKKPEVKKVH